MRFRNLLKLSDLKRVKNVDDLTTKIRTKLYDENRNVIKV